MQLLLPWQFVGQGMGGCPVTSTSLQEILFSRNGCAVVIFWGDVSRAEKEHFTEGVEMYLQTHLDLPQAAVHSSPVKVDPNKRHFPISVPSPRASTSTLCSAMQALWVRSAPTQKEHEPHVQPCLALSSRQAKAELGCPLPPLSYLLCCDYISSICLAPTFSFPLLVF